MTGWSFAGQNLTDANLSGGTLTNADFTAATIAGAHFMAPPLPPNSTAPPASRLGTFTVFV